MDKSSAHADRAQRKDCEKTQGEGGHLQAKERGLQESSCADTWVLDLQPPEL